MKHLLTLAVTSLLATTAFADPIHSAVWNGDLEGVQAELDNGVDVDEKDDLWGRTPLHIAAEEGHKEIAELLIANGADVNAKTDYGETPLDFVSRERFLRGGGVCAGQNPGNPASTAGG